MWWVILKGVRRLLVKMQKKKKSWRYLGRQLFSSCFSSSSPGVTFDVSSSSWALKRVVSLLLFLVTHLFHLLHLLHLHFDVCVCSRGTKHIKDVFSRACAAFLAARGRHWQQKNPFFTAREPHVTKCSKKKSYDLLSASRLINESKSGRHLEQYIMNKAYFFTDMIPSKTEDDFDKIVGDIASEFQDQGDDNLNIGILLLIPVWGPLVSKISIFQCWYCIWEWILEFGRLVSGYCQFKYW